MQTPNQKRTKRNLVIFTVMVLGISALARVIEPLTIPPDADPGASGLGQLLWLVTPLVVMLLLRALGGDGWADLGLRPNFKNNRFWWLASILIFPVIITISVLLGILLGGLTVNAIETADFVSMLFAGLTSAVIKNIFEEFAWRGYLAPKLYSLKMNNWLSHAIVGLIWGSWHLPFVLVLWPYLESNMLSYFIPLLLVGTFSQSVVYGEIRLATDSVLPAWTMHTIGNAIGNTLILSGFVQFVPGREIWASPGAESVTSIILMFLVGYRLHQRRRKLSTLGTAISR